MRRRSAHDACGDATPSNKPLEWTGHHNLTSGTRYSLPATQGQRSKDREEGRRHRREFKEHGNKCSLDDTFI